MKCKFRDVRPQSWLPCLAFHLWDVQYVPTCNWGSDIDPWHARTTTRNFLSLDVVVSVKNMPLVTHKQPLSSCTSAKMPGIRALDDCHREIISHNGSLWTFGPENACVCSRARAILPPLNLRRLLREEVPLVNRGLYQGKSMLICHEDSAPDVDGGRW
jgi:hypothetical protein